jgi:hypothetical protein
MSNTTLSKSGLTAEEQNQSILNALTAALRETREAFGGTVSPDTPVNLERAKRAAKRLSERIGVEVGYERLVRAVLEEAGSEE